MTWKIATTSLAGTSHLKKHQVCQDVCRVEVFNRDLQGEIFVAAIADGAGSVSTSEKAAAFVVNGFISEAREEGFGFNEESFKHWFLSLQRSSIDLDCTFLGAVVDEERAAFVQLGDGAIVVSGYGEEAYRIVCWPQKGEFVNETYFVSHKEAAQKMQYVTFDFPLERVAMFSDGIERLILNFSTRSVHAPALNPIFEWMEVTDLETSAYNEVLADFLNSKSVNERTDDDKTMILATRQRL